MKLIRAVVQGAQGRMGREITGALCADPEIKVVGGTELKVTQDSLNLPDGSGAVPFSSDLDKIITACKPDVIVDFTTAKAVMPAARIATKKGVNLVIGTTGLTPADIDEMRSMATEHKVGIVVAPNFTIGAVLLIHMAKIAAKYLDYAEIIELHHHLKLDAPSGTAISTAKAMAQSKGKPFSQPQEKEHFASRGQNVDGVTIHSVRLPGLMAHQEVIMGAPGQTLSIRHDTISRECYMPGIILAIKEVVKQKGLIYGLDTLLNL